ncbi:hypothetical protein PCANC_19208 [Puccinia coronata f. sp. avenae]|uniref:Uncharacterized protein n=1 Tax=Puccinia coronata f. sp. avenae TaxID=200324 RepID=A0A2N5SHY3_9BASI|nr:hypothetical protein PCANC_19208 [Puccinia coronata f. sp. avenae]
MGVWLLLHLVQPILRELASPAYSQASNAGRHWIGNKMITLSLHDPLAVDICAGSDIKLMAYPLS